MSTVKRSVTFTLKWSKETRELLLGRSCKIALRENTAFLKLLKIDQSHTAEYLCQISIDAGEKSCQVNLVVKDQCACPSCRQSSLLDCIFRQAIFLFLLEPARFVKRLKDIYIEKGKHLILDCSFVGSPKMVVSWMKDGKHIYASYRYNTKVTGNSCILESLFESDHETSGTYSCEISNGATDACHAQITVLGLFLAFTLQFSQFHNPWHIVELK